MLPVTVVIIGDMVKVIVFENIPTHWIEIQVKISDRKHLLSNYLYDPVLFVWLVLIPYHLMVQQQVLYGQLGSKECTGLSIVWHLQDPGVYYAILL